MSWRRTEAVSFTPSEQLESTAITYNPCVLQRHHVINVNVARGGPDTAIIGAGPRSGSGGTGRAGHDVGSVAFQHEFSDGPLAVAFKLTKKGGRTGCCSFR